MSTTRRPRTLDHAIEWILRAGILLLAAAAACGALGRLKTGLTLALASLVVFSTGYALTVVRPEVKGAPGARRRLG